MTKKLNVGRFCFVSNTGFSLGHCHKKPDIRALLLFLPQYNYNIQVKCVVYELFYIAFYFLTKLRCCNKSIWKWFTLFF